MATFEKEMRLAVEFIPDRLYYVAVSSAPPANNPTKHFFSIDNEMVYWNFYLDFGPLNLGHVYRYCCLLNSKLNDPKLRGKVIYYCSSSHPHRRANGAFLICAWAMMFLHKTPEEAFKPFKNYPAPFPPWHDATPGVCTFVLTILDTLRGMHKARECRFFDFDNFNIEEYEHYEQVENGDLNWYVDGKFIAFAGPHADKEFSAGGYYSLRPDDYIQYFKKKNVQLVVRLNKSYYDPKRFSNHGIEHVDMYFLDGSNPPEPILSRFIQKCEETSGAVAVHCKAGLGRTGTVIGCYIMKHYKFTAEEIIGWMRIVRPGSIIGPQQQFMREMQSRMWRDGDLFRANRQALQSLSVDKDVTPIKDGRTEPAEAVATPTRSVSLRRDSQNSLSSSSGLNASSSSSSRTTNAANTPVTPTLARKMNSLSLSATSLSTNNSASNLVPAGGSTPTAAVSPISPAPLVTPNKTSPFGSRPSSLRNMTSTPTRDSEILVSRSANATPSNPAGGASTPNGNGVASTAIAGYFRKSPSTGSVSGQLAERTQAQLEADECDKRNATQGDLLLQRRHMKDGGAAASAAASAKENGVASSEYDPSFQSTPTASSKIPNGHSSSHTTPLQTNGSGTPSGKSFGFLPSWNKN